MSDFPRLREHPNCPKCGSAKPHGLVICWACNGVLKRMYDGTWGPWEGKLAVIEGGLQARLDVLNAAMDLRIDAMLKEGGIRTASVTRKYPCSLTGASHD